MSAPVLIRLMGGSADTVIMPVLKVADVVTETTYFLFLCPMPFFNMRRRSLRKEYPQDSFFLAHCATNWPARATVFGDMHHLKFWNKAKLMS